MVGTLKHILSKIYSLNYYNTHEMMYEIRELLYFLDDEELLTVGNILSDFLSDDDCMAYEMEEDNIISINSMLADTTSESSRLWETYNTLYTIASDLLHSFKKKKDFINKRVAEILEGLDNETLSLSESVLKELKERFYHQTFATKRRIIDYFFKSPDKAYILRACDWLSNSSVWSKRYLNTVEELWLKFHEPEIENLIILHSSEEFLLEHQDSLGTTPRYYNMLCKRLMHSPEFIIKEEKAGSKWCFFTLLQERGADISSHSILEFLFSSILSCLTEKEQASTSSIVKNHNNSYSKRTVESVLNHCYTTFNRHGYFYLTTKGFRNVEETIILLRELKRLDDIMFYLDWDKKIQTICNDKFNQELVYCKRTQQLSVNAMKRIFVEIIIQEFPTEFRYLLDEFPTVKLMATRTEASDIISKTPTLLNIIKDWDLELADDMAAD